MSQMNLLVILAVNRLKVPLVFFFPFVDPYQNEKQSQCSLTSLLQSSSNNRLVSQSDEIRI